MGLPPGLLPLVQQEVKAYLGGKALHRLQALSGLGTGFPIVGRHGEQIHGDLAVWDANLPPHGGAPHKPETRVLRLPVGVFIGVLVQQLLEAVQVPLPRHGVEEKAPGLYHPGELLRRQGGEHVCQQVDACLHQGDGEGACHPELHGFVLARGGLYRQLGDVEPAHPGLGQSLPQAGGVVALPAAGVAEEQPLPGRAPQLGRARCRQAAQLLPEGGVIARLNSVIQ